MACPHCGLETILFLPRSPTRLKILKKGLKRFFTKKKIIIFIISIFIIVAAIVASYFPIRLQKEVSVGVLILLFAAAFISVVYAVSAAKLWLPLFSIALFASGALLLICGGTTFLALAVTKDATVFQEYEAIFFSIGGLVVIALSLILAALVVLIKKKP